MARRRKTQKPEVLEREQQVVALRAQGFTWEQIASHVGYNSASSAHSAYLRAAKRAVIDNLETIRDFEGQRLDIAQTAIWNEVLQGDIPAINTLLKIMERRAKLLGLDQPIRQQVEVISYDGNSVRSELERILAVAGDSSTSSIVASEPSETEPVTTGE